jgi:hypothetical protein
VQEQRGDRDVLSLYPWFGDSFYDNMPNLYENRKFIQAKTKHDNGINVDECIAVRACHSLLTNSQKLFILPRWKLAGNLITKNTSTMNYIFSFTFCKGRSDMEND